MGNFNFFQPTRIHFGVGAIDQLGLIVSKYGKSCLLVTTSDNEEVMHPLYNRVKSLLINHSIKVVHFDEVVPNPTIDCIEKGIKTVKADNISMVLAVGGGSSLDTAKAVALFYGAGPLDWPQVFATYTDPFVEYKPLSAPVLPVIAVPTTAGTGSELTQAMVISNPAHEEKMCIFHDQAFPKEAVLDPALTKTVPVHLTAITGFDAFSHAFESYMREMASPYTQLLGLKAMEIIIQTLPELLIHPGDMEMREKMAQAAMFAGISLANAAASIPHPLSEIIGGITPQLAHGQCLASIYPRYVAFETKNQPDKCAEIASLFESSLARVNTREAAGKLPELLTDFLGKIGLNKSLSELGVTGAELERIKEHFLLDLLPFAPRDVLVAMITESY